MGSMKKKPAWLYRQSGVVPFTGPVGERRIVLITSRKKKRWILPKGVVDRGFSPADSAAKEAYEEAGLIGLVGEDPLGGYGYEKWGGVCTVIVFPMRVDQILDEWPEKALRERILVPIDEAIAHVETSALQAILWNFSVATALP